MCPTLVPKSPSTDIIVSHYAKYIKGLWHNHLVGYPVLVRIILYLDLVGVVGGFCAQSQKLPKNLMVCVTMQKWACKIGYSGV